ncbi:MAG: right-handed parallel beta-helix repeat-containing protein [Elusimicrobiota bacterium]|jgi:hypothetical protein
MKTGKRPFLNMIGALFAAMLLAGTARAADLYVRAGAEGSGTKEAPSGLLWKALDKAVRGDVIHVAEGTYNGKGGCGHFMIKVPDLTLVGGYASDFSARDPFKHPTVLERAKDYAGDWTGLPEGIIASKEGADAGGLILDGFTLNAQSRNGYYDDGSINIAKSYPGRALHVSGANVKIRNCVLLNPLGPGIESPWTGPDNEVVNTFIVDTFREGLSTRSSQKGAAVHIRNCTFAFTWFYPTQGGGIPVFVGREGKTVLENNVIAYTHTEGGSAGYAVSNTFGNDRTALKGNVFFSNPAGYYKYMDEDKKNLLITKPAELKDLDADPSSYMLEKAGGNADADPGIEPPQSFLEAFGKAAPPSEETKPRTNYGLAYPVESVTSLASKLPGKGVQLAGPFAEYKSAAAAEARTYSETDFSSFQKGASGLRSLAGKPVSFKAGMGPKTFTYLLASAPREKYDCYKLNMPGENEMSIKFIHGYFLKGSAAAKAWERFLKRKTEYAQDGLIIKGTAFYAGTDSYNYPAAVLIDAVEVP